MVEREAGKRSANLGPAADDRDLVGWERVSQQAGEEGRGRRSVLGGLEHHPVAGRQGGPEWGEREIDRIVPGRDDADYAERLVDDLGAARQEVEGDGTALRLHPGCEMAGRVLDPRDGGEQVGEQRLVPRSVPEVGGYGGRNIGLVTGDQPFEPPQGIPASLEGRGPSRRKLAFCSWNWDVRVAVELLGMGIQASGNLRALTRSDRNS